MAHDDHVLRQQLRTRWLQAQQRGPVAPATLDNPLAPVDAPARPGRLRTLLGGLRASLGLTHTHS